MWRVSDISFELDESATRAPVLTLRVTVDGAVLYVMGEPVRYGCFMTVHGFHIHGAVRNSFGPLVLRRLIYAAMEEFDFMASKLWEAFERTAHKPDAVRDSSGSPARFELRWEKDFTDTIDAILALRDAGLPLVEAKHKIEELMETRYLRIDLPAVVDVDALVARIARAGAIATVLAPAQAA